MPPMITPFDPKRHHIHIRFFVTDPRGRHHALDGVLDTGAPRTEFSDKFLAFAGFIREPAKNIAIKPGLQTQKYGKLLIPILEICGHAISDFEIFASRFDESWGVDALIGLDFFKKFRVTIDTQAGQIRTEPF